MIKYTISFFSLMCIDFSTKMILLFLIISFSGITYSDPSLNFFVFGDWGGLPFFPYKTFVEMNIGREMAFLSTTYKPDFILALGDNFYLDGVKNVEDARFKETFESAFNYTSLHIPWYVIAGNHDYYGNVTAQILYSSKSDRWNFPDLYYKKSFRVGTSAVDIIMTDSIILCGNTAQERYTQPVLHPSNKYQSEKHWKWLQNALASSKANYLIVCGHFPVYSVGSHGSTQCLVERLKPLLEKYNATAYFSGHDHNIQHVQVTQNNVTMDYFVSGSTNFIDPSKKHKEKLPKGSLLFHWANPFSLGAFMYVNINEKKMNVTVLLNGKKMYSYFKEPRF